MNTWRFVKLLAFDKFIRNDSNSKLPFNIRFLLEAKHGANWKKKIIGKVIRMPFIPHKFAIEYEKLLVELFKRQFTQKINQATKKILNNYYSKQFRVDTIEDDFYSEFDDISQEFNNLQSGFKVLIEKIASSVFLFQKEKYASSTKKAFSVGIELNDSNVLKQLPQWTKTNINLIKNVNQEITSKLKSHITSSFQRGIRAEELIAKIKEIGNYSTSRAKLIARDQISKLYGQMNKQRGSDLGLEKYIWRTSGDERVRMTHRMLDGEERDWNEGIIPGEEIRCRCCGDSIIDASLLE